MSTENDIFLKKSGEVAFDLKHRNTIKFNIGRYDGAVNQGKLRYSNLELAKQRAKNRKLTVLSQWDKYLNQFIDKISSRGVGVFVAENGDEAMEFVLELLKENKAKMIVKSKSMTTEELHFNEHLENNGIESVETDLGEYIVQLAGEPPYHIVTPAMHKSKHDVAKLFNTKFETPIDSTPEYITDFVRNKLREKYVTADVGVSGANFLVADVGAISLTENEGNGMMSVSFPKIHIVIAGIEKLIPSIKDLPLFLPLLAVHGTGQGITAYNSLISGPKTADEGDGPEKMYVVLIDNKRTELLKHEEQRLSLTCIRCGACLNACPIYKNVGGYTYAATYTGPIGSVITPFFRGFEKYNHLSSACSLCGMCTEVCPVKIELHRLLLKNRNLAVKSNLRPIVEKSLIKSFRIVLNNSKLLDLFPVPIKNFFIGKFFAGLWGKKRNVPIVKKSFRNMFKN